MAAGCSNNPYRESDSLRNVRYSTIGEDPKSLDPTFAYDSLSLMFVGQIYETLLQYSFLKRPFHLEPALADGMPEFFSRDGDDDFDDGLDTGKNVEKEKKHAKVFGYRIKIKKGIRFQDDPCFEGGRGREVKSDDFIHALKRIGDPTVTCPINSLFCKKIAGLKEFYEENKKLTRKQKEAGKDSKADFSIPVKGIRRIDDYTFEVRLIEAYPQFLYWLAMPFTAPIPREAVEYYDSQRFPDRRPFSEHPVGTGAYLLKKYRKGHRMVLARNSNFRGERYPSEGEPGDREAGLLEDAGKRLPFVDEWVFTTQKEQTSRWNLFLQGYLDGASIPRSAFDRAITAEGNLSQRMEGQGIRLYKSRRLITYYYAFNMDDPLVGRNKKLRQGLNCAINTAEYIEIYLNSRGAVAQSPLPPGMFGYDPGYRNPYRQYDLEKARELLAEAGYKDGIDPTTKEPLEIKYDTSGTDPASRQTTRWLVKQFEQINIKLKIIVNDWNTQLQKADDGNFQLIGFGWVADYPDPENFLFLLHSKQRPPEGVNNARYSNPEYDLLFDQMKAMSSTGEEGARRLEIISRMVKILEEDCPWVPSFHPEGFSLLHDWVGNVKLHGPGNNLMKYERVNPELRAKKRAEWNRPKANLIWTAALLVALASLPAVWMVWRRVR